MNVHPEYYTHLVRRRVTGQPALTPTEQQELDLHLYICARCAFEYAALLQPRHPKVAEALRRDLEKRLTADMVTPHLWGLAWTLYRDEALDDFQTMIWRFLEHDPEALGRLRLLEAQVWLQTGD
jgi:hypothetical protein